MSVEPSHRQYLKRLGIEVWQPRVDRSFFPAGPVSIDSAQSEPLPIADDESVAVTVQSPPEVVQEARDEIVQEPDQPELDIELKLKPHSLYHFSNLCSVLIEMDSDETTIPADQNRVLVGILRSVGIVSQTEPAVSAIEYLTDVTKAIQHNNNSNIPIFCFSENIQSEMLKLPENIAKLFFETTLKKLVSFPNEKNELWNRLKNTENLI